MVNACLGMKLAPNLLINLKPEWAESSTCSFDQGPKFTNRNFCSEIHFVVIQFMNVTGEWMFFMREYLIDMRCAVDVPRSHRNKEPAITLPSWVTTPIFRLSPRFCFML